MGQLPSIYLHIRFLPLCGCHCPHFTEEEAEAKARGFVPSSSLHPVCCSSFGALGMGAPGCFIELSRWPCLDPWGHQLILGRAAGAPFSTQLHRGFVADPTGPELEGRAEGSLPVEPGRGLPFKSYASGCPHKAKEAAMEVRAALPSGSPGPVCVQLLLQLARSAPSSSFQPRAGSIGFLP